MASVTASVRTQVDVGKLALKALVVRWRKCTTQGSELEDLEFDVGNALSGVTKSASKTIGKKATSVVKHAKKAVKSATGKASGCGFEGVLQIRLPDISIDISAVGASFGIKKMIATASTDGVLEVSRSIRFMQCM